MALFKAADPEKTLQRDLEKRRAIRDALAADLAEAELAVTEKREAAEQLAMDGADVKTRRAATSDLVHAKEYVAVTSGSLTKIGEQIAALEREVAEAADKKMRGETAATITAMADDLAKASDKMAAAMAEVDQAATIVAGRFHEYKQFHGVMSSLKVELPLTITHTVNELRARAAAIIAGSGQAFLPLPALAALPAPPKPALVKVCAVKKIAHTVDGVVKTSPPGARVELLPEVASRAMTLGAVCQLSDPRAKHFESQCSPYVPELANCVGLDATSRAAVSAAAAHHGVVQPIRRSAPPIVDASRPLQQAASSPA
jgi:hypothetical protein